MSKKTNPSPVPDEKTRTILGLDRKRRFKAYAWLSGIIVLTGGILAVAYLQPHRWYTYTDVVSFEQVARDVKVGFVLWKEAEPVSAGLLPEDIVSEPSTPNAFMALSESKLMNERVEQNNKIITLMNEIVGD